MRGTQLMTTNRSNIKAHTRKLWIAIMLTALILFLPSTSLAASAGDAMDSVKQVTTIQLKNLINPVLEKYCREECKLMSVDVQVDLATQDDLAPGFDEAESSMKLAPSSAKINLLIDEKLGPVSRGKVLDLATQYLDVLDYPVSINTKISKFPQPAHSAAIIANLRSEAVKKFKDTAEEIFNRFCPNRCLLVDFEISTEAVNPEEVQYGKPGEFLQEGDTAIKIKSLASTILMDESLSPEERMNILEMARLKTSFFSNVDLSYRSMRFPNPGSGEWGDFASGGAGGGRGGKRGLSSVDSQSSALSEKSSEVNSEQKSSKSDTNQKNEKYEKYEKIERVEDGDAVQKELAKFKTFGIIFSAAVILLLFIILVFIHHAKNPLSPVYHFFKDPTGKSELGQGSGSGARGDRSKKLAARYEIENLMSELSHIFAEHPKVAKEVFGRILTEEGIEVTSQYINFFGEGIVVDLLKDPNLQSNISNLMEFYAKNPIETDSEDKLTLLRKLHNRTVSAKLFVIGNRSSNLFDFLVDMDAKQIAELIRTESLTVKAIIMTQLDPAKRTQIYSFFDEKIQNELLSELTRVDYLPRDYIFNIANSLKLKMRENPKLNTEALPGSEVLVSLLEKADSSTQKSIVKTLELSNPDGARNIKSKLVSLDTLRHIRDSHLLEIILSLKHSELIHFLKGAPEHVRSTIFEKSPHDLVADLKEELESIGDLQLDMYDLAERKIINRIKVLSNEGTINLVEANDRLLSESDAITAAVTNGHDHSEAQQIQKVAGW